MQYGKDQRPFNDWHGIQICYKQQAKRFPQMKCEEQKDNIKIWSMGENFGILPTGF